VPVAEVPLPQSKLAAHERLSVEYERAFDSSQWEWGLSPRGPRLELPQAMADSTKLALVDSHNHIDKHERVMTFDS
jgi:hypothetical protein